MVLLWCVLCKECAVEFVIVNSVWSALYLITLPTTLVVCYSPATNVCLVVRCVCGWVYWFVCIGVCGWACLCGWL